MKRTIKKVSFMKILKWTFGILIITGVPFIIEWIIRNETIFPFNLPIYFSKETWFSFLGSYLGAIGTIVLGIIALKQNKSLSDANSKLSKMQEEYINNLLSPILRMGDSISFEYALPMKDLEKNIQDSIDTKFPIVYDKIADQYKTIVCWHTTMKLLIENCSEIPLTYFKVNSFDWEINGNKHSFRCDLINNMSRTTLIQKYNTFNICIVYPDMANPIGSLAKCGEDIQLLIEPPVSETDKGSKINFEIEVMNQANHKRTFILEIKFYKIERFVMQISEYMIYPKEDTTNA